MSQTGQSDIVITGIGILSPIGIGVETFSESLREGHCGFRRTVNSAHVGTPDSVGGEVVDFTLSTAKKQHLKSVRKQIKVMCREIQMGVASALQAVAHAGLDRDSLAPERIGVEFGANLMTSAPEQLVASVMPCEDSDKEFVYSKWGLTDEGRFQGMEPLWLLRYLPNMPGCHIGIALDARGPNNSHTLDEASGGLVLSEAAGIIRRGRADVMVVGTTGTRVTAVKAGQHQVWDVLAEGPPEDRCRPFDKDRGGEVLAEGACTLILESRTHAEARGATIYGSLLSTAATCVAGASTGADEKAAVAQACRIALERAGLQPSDLGHINACASGHPTRDAFEAAALTEFLGDQIGDVPVTALKSYLGSAGSGSALMELAGSLLAGREGIIPQTLNFAEADSATPLNVVTNEHLPTTNRTFLKTSVTRMGQATAIVVGA